MKGAMLMLCLNFVPLHRQTGLWIRQATLKDQHTYSLIASWEIVELDCVQFDYILWAGLGGTTEQIRTLDLRHLIDKLQCSNHPTRLDIQKESTEILCLLKSLYIVCQILWKNWITLKMLENISIYLSCTFCLVLSLNHKNRSFFAPCACL